MTEKKDNKKNAIKKFFKFFFLFCIRPASACIEFRQLGWLYFMAYHHILVI